jgi:hypothetical protein
MPRYKVTLVETLEGFVEGEFANPEEAVATAIGLCSSGDVPVTKQCSQTTVELIQSGGA